MTDMSQVITPRSDQINADSLLAGPITITITDVEIKPGEQPVTIHYEGEDGKPWRPCKSMARCLVAAWGPDASKYKGRSLTLYCDPKVRWGGMEVGGIRISHMSHIDTAITMALTVTRGNKKPFTVKPLTISAPATNETTGGADTISADEATALEAKCDENGIDIDKLKAAAKVERLSQIRAADLDKAKGWIDRVLKARTAKQTDAAHG